LAFIVKPNYEVLSIENP